VLAPRDRTLLLGALRPPEGYRLDRAVGTSFTLDLMALLTVPLAFTFADWEDDDGRPKADPVALLHALREHARRVHLFCQAGEIRAPRDGQPLFTALEPSVIEARAPTPGRSFHPKLWALRFTDADGGVLYRVLVASRNLTFDRSWDTLLVLEGRLTDRQRHVRASEPLGDFLEALPDLALRALPPDTRAAIRVMSDELRRVRFDPPKPFKELRFHPLGTPGWEGHWPYEGGFKGVVVSPFASDGCEEWNGREVDLQLISRPEALRVLSPAVLARFSRCWILSADADAEEGIDEHEGASEAVADEALTGLHAKLVVLHRGHQAHVFTGSANATAAAHAGNVEFMVELIGGRSRCGLPALLGEGDGNGDGRDTLRELLEPWTPSEVERDADQELIEDLDQRLAEARRALGVAEFALHATQCEPAPEESETGEHEPGFDVALTGNLPELPRGVCVSCWLASQPSHRAVGPAAGEGAPLASFADIALVDLTAFLTFECVASESGTERRARFARHLPLIGTPEDRDERLLRAILTDRDTVLRLLLMLLAQDGSDGLSPDLGGGGDDPSRWGGAGGAPLLESLVRALAREPASLEPVRRLVDDLRRSEDGVALLPEGFADIWDPVEAVARELQG